MEALYVMMNILIALMLTSPVNTNSIQTLEKINIKSETDVNYWQYNALLELKLFQERNPFSYFKIVNYGVKKNQKSKSNIPLKLFVINKEREKKEITQTSDVYEINEEFRNNLAYTSQPGHTISVYIILKFSPIKEKFATKKTLIELIEKYNLFLYKRCQYVNEQLNGSRLNLRNMLKHCIGNEIVINSSDKNYLKELNQNLKCIIEGNSVRIPLDKINQIESIPIPQNTISIDHIYVWKTGTPLPYVTTDGIWIPATYWEHLHIWQIFSKKGYIIPQFDR